jgi:WbqC-like protein
MRVAIHQPHYLPWLGLLHRMAAADVFIVLEHVQFERGNYQNRTQVRVNGTAHWLTVPVVQRSQKEPIAEKEIDWSRDWSAVHYETLRRAYTGGGYFGAYGAELKRIYGCRWQRLVDLNAATLALLREAFAIRTPMVKSSELGVRRREKRACPESLRGRGRVRAHRRPRRLARLSRSRGVRRSGRCARAAGFPAPCLSAARSRALHAGTFRARPPLQLWAREPPPALRLRTE